ncbi:3-methylcrotonyl-CoA carboxylase [Alphaproteobacteria bacterium 46_93_T64]|nr:3-methylcrotonyl-CoA carboxylase [Alphaproteobacteria bacterium 46_93_T64]
MRSFKNILVANRGEIAVRIMKTAQSLGYRAIAVYSEADKNAPHVQMADDTVCIGPAPVQQSYLNMEKILAAARESGADAIHPGYGFLSENAEFSEACAAAGMVFIGPDAKSIELMGNKAAAKRRMIAANVPCVPGYEDADQSDDTFVRAAADIGFPIMVKAAAGGGGRGMRLVNNPNDLLDALRSAKSEALNAFGSDEIILEKAVMRPRHVEVQIFADTLGNVIHLAERDCSVQRRHQKVVEEAPCPVMTDELRARMGAAAVDAARSINYRGAGTVEFLLDESGEFYFLEMNTRLQVEHPVTEMITGLDLVALQIQVAEGQSLGLRQEDISLSGHAIEVRLYTEDTTENFLPCTGHIDLWREGSGGGVRFDSGIQSGQDITPFYDPMIAKAIAWGETREIARHRLIEALKDTVLFGVSTNKRFLIDVLERETFAKGDATTAFISDEFTSEDLLAVSPNLEQMSIAATLQYVTEREQAFSKAVSVSAHLMNWSSGGELVTRFLYKWEEEEFDLTVTAKSDNSYQIQMDSECLVIELITMDTFSARLRVNGRLRNVHFRTSKDGQIYLSDEGHTFNLTNQLALAGIVDEELGGGKIIAPMHGTLLEVFVSVGDRVRAGDRLAVLEAMKMQHDIIAQRDGTVLEICIQPGSQAAANEMIIDLELAEAE